MISLKAAILGVRHTQFSCLHRKARNFQRCYQQLHNILRKEHLSTALKVSALNWDMVASGISYF